MAKLLEGTCQAAMISRDQHDPHIPPGSTTTSIGSWHSGHSRAGDRNSTSFAACVIRINLKMEIARSIVRLGQIPYDFVTLNGTLLEAIDFARSDGCADGRG
jgi:hypothetical protein